MKKQKGFIETKLSQHLTDIGVPHKYVKLIIEHSSVDVMRGIIVGGVVCKNCGEFFTRRHWKQLYCCPECRIKFNYKKKSCVCVICGEDITTKNRSKYLTKPTKRRI